MRILLLEDDAVTGRAIEKGLARDGHDVTLADTTRAALALAGAERFDVAVLDIGLPDGSGYAVLEEIRRSGRATQVLMLTARGDVGDRVEGLDRGADDYLVKPFSFAELAARVRALARRPVQALVLRVGPVELDVSSGLVTVAGAKLELTPIQFRLLAALMRAGGESVPRKQLLAAVWDYDFDPQTNLVDVHINRLRRKLEEVGAGGLVRTVRGAGYAIP